MILIVALAGGLGAAARLATDVIVARHNRLRVPMGTFVVNVVGSFLLGLLTGAVVASDGPGTQVRAIVGTGFCGGYTTFSTASVEAVRLWLVEGRRTGLTYAGATLVATVVAAGFGLLVGGLAAG